MTSKPSPVIMSSRCWSINGSSSMTQTFNRSPPKRFDSHKVTQF